MHHATRVAWAAAETLQRELPSSPFASIDD